MQHRISIERFHPSAQQSPEFKGIFPPSLAESMMSSPRPASTVYAEFDQGWADLLIWLPGVSERILDGLAHQEPDIINKTSSDYLSNRTWMTWRFEDVEVEIDMWNLNQTFPCGDPMRGFGVALFNDLNGRYAAHCMNEDEVDSLIGGLQGAMTNSGPHYNPVRQWGDKFLDKHSGKEDVPGPGIIRPTSLAWHVET